MESQASSPNLWRVGVSLLMTEHGLIIKSYQAEGLHISPSGTKTIKQTGG